MIRSNDKVLTLDCLPENLRAAPLASASRAAVLDVALLTTNLLRAGESDIYRRVCLEVDRVVMETVLRHAKGNQVQASALLGISRTTLRAKMRALRMTVRKSLVRETSVFGGLP
jgi:DNA-binding protein Fis